ncbi:MAG: hypothetical protein ACOX7H_04880 [Bacillota bacterium]|jgi:hypothetical protein
MDKKDNGPALVLAASLTAIALTDGMDVEEMNILGNFLTLVVSSIDMLIAAQGVEVQPLEIL